MKKFTQLSFFVLLFLGGVAQAENNPNGFIENKGQWPSEVQFLYKSGGVNAWITDDGVVYDFYKVTSVSKTDGRAAPSSNENRTQPVDVNGHVVKMKLTNSFASTVGQSIGKSDAVFNYIKGNNPSKWASDVSMYSQFTLKGIYDGIDIKYYTEKGSLRYDFIVGAEADPTSIEWNIDGVKTHIDEKGQLVFETSLGEVKQAELYAYQEIDGVRKQVACAFKIDQTNTVKFELGAYDSSKPLVIDPILYSTLIGTGDNDWINGIQVNAQGESIVSGTTLGADFPTVVGAYSTTNAGAYDVFISKFNQDGSALIYSTFIGGSDNEVLVLTPSMLDADGGLVLIGGTLSTDFPTVVGGYDDSYNGGQDAFILKLNAAGSSLQFSTFLGGDLDEFGQAVVRDNAGNIIITGNTYAGNFPITGGAYDQTENGGGDIYIAKFNSTCSSLLFSTLIGGDKYDSTNSIRLDVAGNIVIAGRTESSNFPTTAGVFDQTHHDKRDIVVFKMNSTGSSLLMSTYIGGTGQDQCWGMEMDPSGSIYVVGSTSSSDFPLEQPLYSSIVADTSYQYSAYVLKLNGAGTALEYSTFLGDSAWGEANDIKIDANNTVYVGGWITNQTFADQGSFPITTDAIQPQNNGNGDQFLTRINEDGSEILYSTFIGGYGVNGVTTWVNEEIINGLVPNDVGEVYLAGVILTTDFPTTANAFDQIATFNDVPPTEAFYTGTVMKLNTCPTDFSTASSNSPVCENSDISLMADGGSNYSWSGPNGYTSNQQNPTFVATAQSAGTYTVTVTDNGCTSTSDITVAVNAALGTTIIGPANVQPLTPTSYVVSQTIGSTYTWSATNGGTLISGQGTNSVSITFPNMGTAVVTVIETNGNCSQTATFNVNVGCVSNPNPPTISGAATANANAQETYSVPAQSGYSYTWTVSGGNIVSGQGTNAINVQWGNPGAGTVSIVWANSNGCESTPATTNVTVGTTTPTAQWITVNGDATGDGANPQLMDGTLLEYMYKQAPDSLYFRITTASISAAQSQDVGVNVMVNIPNAGSTFNFWGTDNTDAWHKLVTAWVTGSAPSNYSGTNGISDATGVGANNFTNLYANNISLVVNPTASTIVIGMKRADLISNAQMGSGIKVAAAVGAHDGWNDDIYLPGSTITVAPSGINERAEVEQLHIYPNPSNGLFNLNLANTQFTTKASITVLDNTGREIFNATASNSQTSIDLSGVANGIYLVRVLEGDRIGTARVQKLN